MTDRDLGGFFFMAFLVGIISCLGELFGLVRYREIEIAMSWWVALLAPTAARCLVSAALLVASMSLNEPKGEVPRAMIGNGRWIMRMLQACGLLLALTGVHALAVLGGEAGMVHVRTAIALIITGLLYVATKRRFIARGGRVDR